MKRIMFVGIVLIVVGLLGLVYHGITYTTRETVVQVGPVQVTTEKEKSIPFPPIIGVGSGLVLVLVGARRS